MRCEACGEGMVRVRFFDPDGAIPLATVKDEDGDEWVCTNCNKGEVNHALQSAGVSRISQKGE